MCVYTYRQKPGEFQKAPKTFCYCNKDSRARTPAPEHPACLRAASTQAPSCSICDTDSNAASPSCVAHSIPTEMQQPAVPSLFCLHHSPRPAQGSAPSQQFPQLSSIS